MRLNFPIMAGNKQQVEFIAKNLLKKKSIAISAPMGSGKQTLVVESLSFLRKKMKRMNIIRVEMAGARKPEDLVRILLHELHNHFFTSRITFLEAWQTWLPEDRMSLFINDSLLEIIPEKEEAYLENIFEFLRILIRKTGAFFCWFSNCESLRHWDDAASFCNFISSIRKISNCYVLVTDTLEYEARSHQHILEKVVEYIPAYSPSTNEWIKWMMPKFKEKKITLTRAQAGKIAGTFKGFPLYTSQLVEWLLNQDVKEIGLKEYECGRMEIIERYAPWFNYIIQELSNTQFSLLRAVCSPELKYTSVRVMLKYHLGTPRNVAKNLETLQRNGMIRANGRIYELADPAFEIWFRINFI